MMGILIDIKQILTQSHSTQRIYPVAHVLKLPTCLSLPFRFMMSTQDVQVEALQNITFMQQLILLLFAISLFAKVQLLLPEFFCEGTM